MNNEDLTEWAKTVLELIVNNYFMAVNTSLFKQLLVWNNHYPSTVGTKIYITTMPFL